MPVNIIGVCGGDSLLLKPPGATIFFLKIFRQHPSAPELRGLCANETGTMAKIFLYITQVLPWFFLASQPEEQTHMPNNEATIPAKAIGVCGGDWSFL